MDWSRETKLKAMSEAVNFLRERATQIAARIARNETEITVFSRLHDLASDPRDDTLRQRIDQTNTQLTTARVELATASAQRELAQKVLGREVDVEGTPLNSALLTSLRADRARAMRERAQHASNLGSNHPEVVSGDSEVASIDAMIETEIRRVVDELGGRQRVIEQRMSRLETQLTELQDGVRLRARAEIRMRELERDLLADQKLHDLVVARLGSLDPYTEIAKPSARVVSAAAVPTKPSFPQSRRIFFGGVVGSVVLAIVLALALESVDVRVRSGQRIGQLVQLPHLADIPRLPSHVPGEAVISRQISGHGSGRPIRICADGCSATMRRRCGGRSSAGLAARSVLDELVEHPRSTYAEALRSLYLACRSQVTVPRQSSCSPRRGRAIAARPLNSASPSLQREMAYVRDLSISIRARRISPRSGPDRPSVASKTSSMALAGFPKRSGRLSRSPDFTLFPRDLRPTKPKHLSAPTACVA